MLLFKYGICQSRWHSARIGRQKGTEEMTTPTVPPTMPIGQAFRILGIQGSISKSEEITSAFRKKVKAASVGHGNFRGDMDILTQAKEILLEALAIAYAKAEQAQARERAQQQEREERERLKAKQAR